MAEKLQSTKYEQLKAFIDKAGKEKLKDMLIEIMDNEPSSYWRRLWQEHVQGNES